MAVPLIAIEIVVGFGVPVAWGVWQLVDLRRERQREAIKAPEPAQATAHDRPEAARDSAPGAHNDCT
jgi:hypothetical protein